LEKLKKTFKKNIFLKKYLIFLGKWFILIKNNGVLLMTGGRLF